MLIYEPTAEKLAEWNNIWKEYKGQIKPNRKSGEQLVEYLTGKYPMTAVSEINEINIFDMVYDEIKGNDYFSWRLPVGKKPIVKAFVIDNKDDGSELYNSQDSVFKGLEIFVAVDLVTGYYHAEGSSRLYDELCAFQGVDEIDLQNPFLVAQYVECAKKYGIDI